MFFQECMPAQQISPSAARRSPLSLATLAASRNVAAIFLVLPLRVGVPVGRAVGRVDADDAVLADAVLVEDLGDAAGLFHGQRRTWRGPASLPMAEPPTVPGQTGATSEPTARPLAAILSAMRADRVVAGVGIGVRMEQEQIDAFELLAVDVRRWPSARACGRG